MLVPAVRLYFVRLPPISYFSLPYWISSSWRIGSVPEHQMRVQLSCCLKAFTSLHRICHRARAPSLAMRVETGKHQFRRARNGLEIAACATEDRPPLSCPDLWIVAETRFFVVATAQPPATTKEGQYGLLNVGS